MFDENADADNVHVPPGEEADRDDDVELPIEDLHID
jgi:hypothetical protein